MRQMILNLPDKFLTKKHESPGVSTSQHEWHHEQPSPKKAVLNLQHLN